MLMFMFLLSGCKFFARAGVEGVVESFLNAAIEEDVDKAMKYCTGGAKDYLEDYERELSYMSKEELAAKIEENKNLMTYEIEKIEIDDDEADVEVRVKYEGESTFTMKLSLTKVDDEWKIYKISE